MDTPTTVSLEPEELALIIEAIDSHRYWQVADQSQRNNGDVHYDEADDNHAELLACDDLEAKLSAVAR